MHPRRERPRHLLVGELAALIATINETSMSGHPPKFQRPDPQHQHRGLSIRQRRGCSLHFDPLPGRNQPSQRSRRLMPREHDSCTGTNLRSFRELGDTRSPHGCRYCVRVRPSGFFGCIGRTLLRAVLDPLPIPFPLLSPVEGVPAHGAGLGWKGWPTHAPILRRALRRNGPDAMASRTHMQISITAKSLRKGIGIDAR